MFVFVLVSGAENDMIIKLLFPIKKKKKKTDIITEW